MKFDFLIVGAGLFGATCARVLHDAGLTVKIIEARPQIGGNCFDVILNGIPVNKYGGHVFHTNNRDVWEYANRFAEWQYYEHRVKARVGSRVYTLPPNLTTFQEVGVDPGPEGEAAIRRLLFEGYTQKQWGRPIDQVPASVLARVPFRYNYDDRYYGDRFQGLPIGGYTQWIKEMIGAIPVDVGTDFLLDIDGYRKQAGKVIYSGPLDALFEYQLGRLEYRSLRFRTEILDVPNYQGCPTMNYPAPELPYTRIMEWQHFGWRSASNRTVITIEYPTDRGDPYYPIGDDTNLNLHGEYYRRVQDLPWLIVGGRLGSYRYFNMDQVVAQAHKTCSRILADYYHGIVPEIDVKTTSGSLYVAE